MSPRRQERLFALLPAVYRLRDAAGGRAAARAARGARARARRHRGRHRDHLGQLVRRDRARSGSSRTSATRSACTGLRDARRRRLHAARLRRQRALPQPPQGHGRGPRAARPRRHRLSAAARSRCSRCTATTANSTTSASGRAAGVVLGTVDLRDPARWSASAGPFDPFAHTPDVRPITRGHGAPQPAQHRAVPVAGLSAEVSRSTASAGGRGPAVVPVRPARRAISRCSTCPPREDDRRCLAGPETTARVPLGRLELGERSTGRRPTGRSRCAPRSTRCRRHHR